MSCGIPLRNNNQEAQHLPAVDDITRTTHPCRNINPVSPLASGLLIVLRMVTTDDNGSNHRLNPGVWDRIPFFAAAPCYIFKVTRGKSLSDQQEDLLQRVIGLPATTTTNHPHVLYLA